MGIVNVTPDSFFDGGAYLSAEQAVAHALELAEQGADLLDLGAESTRPGATPVSEEEEITRLLPVVRELVKRTTVPLSVDTMKARVARVMVEMGACIINDVTALRFDSEMVRVVAESGAGVVLMHMQGMPQTMQDAPYYTHVVDEVAAFFDERMRFAQSAGITKSQIVLDPGIGFGKLQAHNLTLLAELNRFSRFERPIAVGVSRKGFIGQIVGRPVHERTWGTAAAVAVAIDHGAHILRVHDVASMKDVVRVAAAIRTAPHSARQEDHA
ncbi:MAG: dihydropteroate synthase [Nitrospira sp.]